MTLELSILTELAGVEAFWLRKAAFLDKLNLG